MSGGFCCRRNRRSSVEYEAIDNPYSEESSLINNRAIGHRTNDDLNLWSNADDFTHSQSQDDRELFELLEQRDRAKSATEYQITSDKVERMRTNRRKIQDRWKSVLRELGFEDEDELQKLVSVTALSRPGTSHFSMKADNLHSALCRDTLIFGKGPSQRNRYATVLSRLLDLDIAEDFVAMAKKLYPRVDPELMSDLEWDQHPTDYPHFNQHPSQNSTHHQAENLDLSSDTNNNASERQ